MTVVPVLLLIVPGLLLALSAFSRRAPPAPSGPVLPIAKIEDGTPIVQERSTGRGYRIRFGRLFVGSLLVVFGAVATWVLYGLGQWGDMLKMGRPVRIRGRCRIPRVARGPGGHDLTRPKVAGLGLWRRARLGAHWHAAARAEYASIPAFELLAKRLHAAGAPAALIDRCTAAALDEDRHARRCFALARAYSSISWRAGHLPSVAPETVDLTALAVESFVDGCVGEGFAAEIARRGAELATDPVIAETLTMLADDEARHAELAWAVVTFCRARVGDAISHALTAASRSLALRPSPGPTGVPSAERSMIAARVVARECERLTKHH